MTTDGTFAAQAGTQAAAPAVRVLAEPLSVDAAIAAVKHPGAGAVVVMIGCVRDHTRRPATGDAAAGTEVAATDVVAVTHLHYEAYAEMAERVIMDVALSATAGVPGMRAAVLHRVGDLEIGDLAVVVAVASPHRHEAFVACRAIIDRLKEQAPIWKKETGDDGTSWVGLGP
jgi:molybdopterin synthase catalytic subunit